MDTAEAWVKLLYTYGPFAILIFFVFVTERKTRAAKNEATRDEKSKLIILYLLNWVVIFGLVIFSLYAWSRINLGDELEIRGRIENLSGKEIVVVSTSVAKLYLHRAYTLPGRADYFWRLVGSQRFSEGEKITIVFDPNIGESFITNNELTIKSDYYQKEVRLRYGGSENKLYVDENGTMVPLPQSQQTIAETPAPPWSFFSTVAYAQGSFQGDAFANSLESPDPVIRRNARSDLAKQGGNAIPWINEVLSYSNTSYRLKIGVIIALNHMSNLNAGMFQPAAIANIQAAAFEKDDALRNESLSLLQKLRISFPVTVYEHVAFVGRNQGFIPGRYRADYGQLGRLPNDSASSLRVQRGYRVRLCENEGNGAGSGKCQEFKAGSWALRWTRTSGVADRVSFIEVRSDTGVMQQMTSP
jgi:hypothetical protein